ncbi:unnamed protein product [Cuscuta campestris]|uniref:Uncharacterized protein n=1 Tax=Cuscuta campestris TaxID=132261 RepID=A0A484KU41_9ASTE|nr:unnamed protein product [Cuscuta campestris]
MFGVEGAYSANSERVASDVVNTLLECDFHIRAQGEITPSIEFTEILKVLRVYLDFGFHTLTETIDTHSVYGLILNVLFELRACHVIPVFVRMSGLHLTEEQKRLDRASMLVPLLEANNLMEASTWILNNMDVFDHTVPFWDTEMLIIALVVYSKGEGVQETFSRVLQHVNAHPSLTSEQVKDLIMLLYRRVCDEELVSVSEVKNHVTKLFDKVWKPFCEGNGVYWIEIPSRSAVDDTFSD